jgi:hypothetical protein
MTVLYSDVDKAERLAVGRKAFGLWLNGVEVKKPAEQGLMVAVQAASVEQGAAGARHSQPAVDQAGGETPSDDGSGG